MPPTVRESAETDREGQRSLIQFFQAEIVKHKTTPLLDASDSIKSAELLWGELLQTHRRLIGTVAKDSVDFKAFEADHHDLLSQCMQVRREFMKIQSDIDKAQGQGQAAGPSQKDIRLPRIELPKFSGNVLDWVSFKDQFTSIVHNSTLSAVQKLNYLQSSVTGEAEKVINGLSLIDANYQIAFDLLKDRYENEREIIFSVFKRFTSQSPINDSGSALRGLIDTSKSCIRSLEQFNVTIGDEMLVYMITQKLDSESRKFWELSLKDHKIPKFNDVMDLLEQRARALAIHGNTKMSKPYPRFHPDEKDEARAQVNHINSKPCPVCGEKHPLFKCQNFHSMTVPERNLAVRQAALCMNCLSDGHRARKCPSKFACHKCRQRHHTLLHEEEVPAKKAPAVNLHVRRNLKSQTLFATAVVLVKNARGEEQLYRVALDNFSSDSFIEESMANRLGLLTTHNATRISGLGGASLGHSKGSTSLTFTTHFTSDFNRTVEVLVVKKLVSDLPSFTFDTCNWSHIVPLQLADPNFFRPGKVDILLGGDIFWDLVLGQRRKGPPGTPMAINSTLGWLVVGAVEATSSKVMVHHIQSLDDLVQRFWELESIPEKRILTAEETKCEENFQLNHKRDPTGRYAVNLPFKSDPPSIGHSREIAIRRLKSVEKRLERLPQIKATYHDFMRKYQELGHMRKVSPDGKSNGTCYIPHHFVLKDPESLEKFKVVFDASAKTSNGISLNECLMVGPTLQDSLVALLTRFRTHRIGFTADIGKMFRQILVNPHHRKYQRIVWRDDPQSQPEDYELETVTYGTAAAPYLATRVLNQLAMDEESELPLAATVTRRDFYVDDLMSGVDEETMGKEVAAQLIQLMNRGGFPILKWASNSRELLDSIPEELRATQSVLPISTEEDSVVSTLGLNWNTATDRFSFKVKLPPPTSKLTKRTLLAEVSKIFDPLGWMAPVVIRAKILLQELWKLNIGWDDQLVDPVSANWTQIRGSLQNLERVTLPRYVHSSPNSTNQLHGFCDASERAYAAVVYLRVSEAHQQPKVHLITAKTRVAPTKTISLPRLELCGALLLSSLMESTQDALRLEYEKVVVWTDSTVTLEWIKSQPSRWKTFVANRVTKIQDAVPPECWNHVSGIDNPADCASRGICPNDLINHPLWWHGPRWLRDTDPIPVPSSPTTMVEEVFAEERKQA